MSISRREFIKNNAATAAAAAAGMSLPLNLAMAATEDEIRWEPPLGAAGDLFAGPVVERDLQKMFRFRHHRLAEDLALHAGCVAGAAQIDELESMLQEAGFTDIRIRPVDGSKELIREWAPGGNIEDFIVSATIEATKPRNASGTVCSG